MFKRNPEGYKNLLVYRKADELHADCLELADEIKKVGMGGRGEKGGKGGKGDSGVRGGGINKTLLELADQIGRAARSPKSNIVEGWKRNSTKEYFDFLGFSIGSTEEINEDCSDIIKGKYKELMGVKGIIGEREVTIEEVERLPFYPLNSLYPLVVRVKLRCKELSLLLFRLQKSLDDKMTVTGELPLREKLKRRQKQYEEENKWVKEYMEKLNKNKGEEGE